jgi:hypothetical protein
MYNQPDVGTLLSAVADYGMTIIPADGIAIIKRTAGGFRPVVIREVYEPDIVGVEQVVELVAAAGRFQHVHRIDDLSEDRRWGKLPLPSSLRTWRSFLMVASERQTQTNAPVTFVWWSRRTSAFADQTDIAVLFARAAGLAIHIVDTRDNLVQAVLARHRWRSPGDPDVPTRLLSRSGDCHPPTPIAAHQPESSDHCRRDHPDW